MGVDYFTCQNCNEPTSEYNRIYCESCESEMCSCCMPDDLAKRIGIWDHAWEFVTTDEDGTLIARDNLNEHEQTTADIILKYCINDDYKCGLELKKDYCPVCARRQRNEQDPEYKEYLRLKRKFES